MSYQEKGPNSKWKDRISLVRIRESIQLPKSAVELALADIKRTVSPQMLRKAQSAFDRLRATEEKVRSGNALTLTLIILEAIERQNENDAETLLRKRKNFTKFAILSDMTSGMESVSEALRNAVFDIARVYETQAMQSEEELVDLINPDPLKQIDWHFKFERDHQKVRRSAILLIEDSSGFSVVDAEVEESARRSVRAPYSKELIMAGAGIASQIYKTIYPQAQALLRPLVSRLGYIRNG